MSDKKHYKYSPSASSRQLNCPGSVSLEADQPNYDSVYSSEGTDAHDCAEIAVMGMVRSKEYPEFTEDPRFDDEMRQHALAFAEFVSGLMAEYDERPRVIPEKQVVSERYPNYGGTVDVRVVGVAKGRLRIDIIDYKYGQGVPVVAKENTQLLDYLNISTEAHRSSMDPNTWPTMFVHVFQPRMLADKPSDSWEVEPPVLWAHDDRRAKNISLIESGEAEGRLSVGGHCQFCSAKAICPAQHEQANELAQIQFGIIENPTTPAPIDEKSDEAWISKTVDGLALLEDWPARAAWVLEREETIRGLCKAVRQRALADAQRGVEIPGYKVVEKRGNRKWIDDDEALRKLAQRKSKKGGRIGKRGATEPKLLSPAQIEKAHGKDALKGLVEKPSTGVKLVPESAKGDAIECLPAAEFFETIEPDLSWLE